MPLNGLTRRIFIFGRNVSISPAFKLLTARSSCFGHVRITYQLGVSLIPSTLMAHTSGKGVHTDTDLRGPAELSRRFVYTNPARDRLKARRLECLETYWIEGNTRKTVARSYNNTPLRIA